VRRAAQSSSPIDVTDRGKPVAVLANPALLTPTRRRRTLLAEYKALLSRKTSAVCFAIWMRSGATDDRVRHLRVAKFYVPEKESPSIRRFA